MAHQMYAMKSAPQNTLLLVENEREEALNAMLDSAQHIEAQLDIASAERQFLQALDYARSVFGAKSLHVATALLGIAGFYSRQEKYQSARPYYEDMQRVLETNRVSGN
jgi:hypothetical protein